MKKALILFLILILMCMVKLGYELLNLSAQQSEFSSSLHQIEQNNANLSFHSQYPYIYCEYCLVYFHS